jgi:hypothetical protein
MTTRSCEWKDKIPNIRRKGIQEIINKLSQFQCCTILISIFLFFIFAFNKQQWKMNENLFTILVYFIQFFYLRFCARYICALLTLHVVFPLHDINKYTRFHCKIMRKNEVYKEIQKWWESERERREVDVAEMKKCEKTVEGNWKHENRI